MVQKTQAFTTNFLHRMAQYSKKHPQFIAQWIVFQPIDEFFGTFNIISKQSKIPSSRV